MYEEIQRPFGERAERDRRRAASAAARRPENASRWARSTVNER
jgi:hypothetical protein